MPNNFEKWLNIPRSQWKRYRLTLDGGLGRYYYIVAPNKTVARYMARGELNSWVKIVRIDEVKE